MARSPQLKVYDASGEYRASCKYPEDAAVLAATLGNGSTVRYQHKRIVWTYGEESTGAQSFDEVANIIMRRV